MREILCKIYGDVQGVSFRGFARQKAQELGVTGTAENLEDGTVEIIAQGKESVLKKYLEYIYAGPSYAQVESVNVQWGPVTEPMADFKII